MTFKIQAGQRLKITAKANEQQARQYLKSLGVTVGKMTDNTRGEIRFEVKDPNAVMKIFTKAFGKPKGRKMYDGDVYLFSTGSAGREVSLMFNTSGDANTVALYDSQD